MGNPCCCGSGSPGEPCEDLDCFPEYQFGWTCDVSTPWLMDAWFGAFVPLMNANGKIDLGTVGFKYACPYEAFAWKCFGDIAAQSPDCCNYFNTSLPCPIGPCPNGSSGLMGKNNPCELILGVNIAQYPDAAWEATAWVSNSRGGACKSCPGQASGAALEDGPFAGGVKANECAVLEWPKCQPNPCCCHTSYVPAQNVNQDRNDVTVPNFTLTNKVYNGVTDTIYEWDQPANNPIYPCCQQGAFHTILCELGNPRRMQYWDSNQLVQRNSPTNCGGYLYPDVINNPNLYRIAVRKQLMTLAGGGGSCLRLFVKIEISGTLVNLPHVGTNGTSPGTNSIGCLCAPIVFHTPGGPGLTAISTTAWYYRDILPTDPIPGPGDSIGPLTAFHYENSPCGAGGQICGQEEGVVVQNAATSCTAVGNCPTPSSTWGCENAGYTGFCTQNGTLPYTECQPEDNESEVACTPRPHVGAPRPRGMHFNLPNLIYIDL